MARVHPSAPFTLIAAGVLLLAFAVRAPLLTGEHRLHADEAYFAAFARDAVLHGRWLLPGDLDKPPLAIYAMAFSMALFAAHPTSAGVLDMSVHAGEFAARLPGHLAVLVLISALISTARRMYRVPSGALWSGMLLALSPLSIVFSPTAFTDGLMLMSSGLALRAAAGGAPGWAGVWIGAACAAKPQGIFFLPFVLIVLAMRDRLTWTALVRIGAAGMLWAGGLLAWDVARGAATPFYALGAANNPLSPFAPSHALVERTTRWFGYVGTWAGWALPALMLAAWRGRAASAARSGNMILAAAIAVYIGLHVIGGVAVYDRYALIPLIPTCLLLGQGSAWLMRRPLVLTAAVLALAAGTADALSGRLPVGGDGGEGRYGVMRGIDMLAAWTDALPTAAVVYDPWLGWHMRFYRSAWADERFVHFPTPDALAAGAAALTERGTRWLIAPRSADLVEWRNALENAGFSTRLEVYIDRFVVVRIEPP